MLQVKNLTKIYGENVVLNNINLEFEPNKIYGVLGRNGAGKTTLVNIITNRAFATNGIVEIDGSCSYENDKAQENIFCITERSAYPTTEKVSDLFKWASRFYPNFDMKYALKLAERFDLEINKKYGKLSTGYTTITKVILTLASNAPYMVFDEPVLGIDAIYREIFYEELKNTHKKLENTIIICSHILDEVENVVDNAVILKKGRTVFNGHIGEITKKHSLQKFYLDLHKRTELSEVQETQIEKLKRKNKMGKVDYKKMKHSLHYLLSISWVQYLVIVGILMLFIVLALFVPQAKPGTEIMLWINLIVVGLVVHGYYFKYALYNGVSRKTYFIALMSILLLTAVVISIPSVGTFAVLEHRGGGTHLATALYGNSHFLTVYAWFVVTGFFMLALSLLSMVLYQALTRKGRYIAMIILVLIMIGFTLWGTLSSASLASIFMFLFGLKPNLGAWFGIMWLAIFGAIFSVVSWLIIRRTEVK